MTANTPTRVLLVLGWFTAATLVVFAVWARFPVPYRDDWEWLEWLLAEPPSLRRLFVPHNEHLIPIARLLVWLQTVAEGLNGHLLFVIALIASAGVVVVFWREISARWPNDGVRRRFAHGAALLLLSSAWQLQSLVFVAAVLFPLVQVFAALAFSSVAAAGTLRDTGARRWAIGSSLLAALGAVLTTTNGIAVPAIVALTTVFSRRTRALAAAHAGLTAGGVLLFATLVLSTRSMGVPDAVTSSQSWPTVIQYFFAFFAPFVTATSESVGTGVGLLIVAISAATMMAIWRSGDVAPRIERFALAMMIFVAVSALLAAVARAPLYGAVQSSQSRYATLTLSFWTALVLAIMSLTSRGAESAVVRFARRLRVSVTLPAALAFIAIHLLAGLVWVAKTGNVTTAGLAMASGVRDDEWIRSLHPSPEVVYDVLTLARARGDRSLIDPHIGERVAVDAALNDCGAMLTLETTPDGRARRLSGRVPADVASGWVLDADRVVVGLAGPAPIVDAPAPTPGHVAAVVRRAIATRTWPGDDRWIGFVPGDVRAPFGFVGLTADRQIACRSAIRQAPGARSQ